MPASKMNKPLSSLDRDDNQVPDTGDHVDRSDGRVFIENVKIYHDLWKLEVEPMEKNVSWNEIPDYQKVEHCHFFHTFDSAGKAQTFCVPVGGHFHEMEVIQEPGKMPKVVCKSGPLKWARQKNKRTGRFEKVLVPFNDVDEHRHETIYLHSKQVETRKINSEATKLIGKNAALVQKPAGLDLK